MIIGFSCFLTVHGDLVLYYCLTNKRIYNCVYSTTNQPSYSDIYIKARWKLGYMKINISYFFKRYYVINY